MAEDGTMGYSQLRRRKDEKGRLAEFRDCEFSLITVASDFFAARFLCHYFYLFILLLKQEMTIYIFGLPDSSPLWILTFGPRDLLTYSGLDWNYVYFRHLRLVNSPS